MIPLTCVQAELTCRPLQLEWRNELCLSCEPGGASNGMLCLHNRLVRVVGSLKFVVHQHAGTKLLQKICSTQE